MLTIAQLCDAVPFLSAKRATELVQPLNDAMAEFDINSPLRIAAFLAQVGHESASFRYVAEIADGKAYDTGRLAARLGNTPEADGDGQKYKGHGFIQVTGAKNHWLCAQAFGIRFETIPAWLQTVEGACRSAGWFWKTHGLNELADLGKFQTITKRINGGLNGWEDRLTRYLRAKNTLGCNVPGIT